MNNKLKSLLPVVLLLMLVVCCRKKDETTVVTPAVTTTTPSLCPNCNFPDTVWTSTQTGPMLIFKFKFDSTQVRLNNTGNTSTVTTIYGSQSPKINGMSANYIELSQNDQTPLGQGIILYRGSNTACGGDSAGTFCKSVICKEGETFFSIPLSRVATGSYKWMRISIGYQNYDVKIKNTSSGFSDGTIAAFTAANTYVTKYKMKNTIMTPQYTGNKTQGYWGFYASIFNTPLHVEGQTNQTTVVNPNAASALPAGSSVITGEFYKTSASAAQPLVISGTETQDVIITVSLSTNKSFEWGEVSHDGLFQPDIGEQVIDFGLRGLIPKH